MAPGPKPDRDWSVIIREFPSLKDSPTDPHALLEWIESSARGEAADHAAMFVLELAGIGFVFDVEQAFRVWDDAHQAAYARCRLWYCRPDSSVNRARPWTTSGQAGSTGRGSC